MELIIINIVSAVLAAWVASARGRNLVVWFLLGFFFGPIGLVVVAVLPDLRREQRRYDQISNEHRRLREQIRQERMKNESFRRYSADRLDAHDEALHLDTRNRQVLPGQEDSEIQHMLEAAGASAEAAEPGDPAGQAEPAPPADDAWYYEDHGESRGPVDRQALIERLRSGQVDRQTLVWSAALGQWTPAGQVEQLRWKDAA